MRALLMCLVVLAATLAASCTNMRDCCECLQRAGELNCDGPAEVCVEGCFQVCEPTDACYCSAAIRADCSAECGCAF